MVENINLLPITNGLLGTRYCPHQHPLLANSEYPISNNVVRDSFIDVENEMKKYVKEKKTTLPLLFNINFNEDVTSLKQLVIFADCETADSTGRPITFFLYCLNDKSSIYIKMKPTKAMGPINISIHGITTNYAKRYHHFSTKEGTQKIKDWIEKKRRKTGIYCWT